MKTDVVAKALRLMALDYLGLPNDSTFPDPGPPPDLNYEPDTEKIICPDLDACFPDLMELRILGVQLQKYAQLNKRSVLPGKLDGIYRFSTAVWDILWAAIELRYPETQFLKITLVNGKAALVETPKSKPNSPVAELLRNLLVDISDDKLTP